MPAAAPHVALIRGINLGKAKQVAMADLRAALERRGFADVRTLLNSGNVVFSTARSPRAATAEIERALEEDLAVTASVLVLTAEQFDAAVAANRLFRIATNHSRHYVAFLWQEVAALEEMRRRDWGEEALALGPRAAYLWCPEGFGSPLVKAFHQAVGTGVTVRTWTTVRRLQAALRDHRAPGKNTAQQPAKQAAARTRPRRRKGG